MSSKTKAQLIAENETLQKRTADLQAVKNKTHYKKYANALHERTKELDCLYGISRLAETKDLTIQEILQGCVELLPSAFQYPEITCARITLGVKEYRTHVTAK